MIVTIVLSLLAYLAPYSAPPTVLPLASPCEDAAALLETIKGEKDDVDPDLIDQLAELGTSAALEGLFEAYEVMGSVYMRRAVMRGVTQFDGVPKLSKPALQFLSDVATAGKDRNLRHYAVELLAEFQSGGRAYLQLIVESEADQEVRELALEKHVAAAVPADHDWYRKLYEPRKQEDKDGRKKRRDDDVVEPERPTPGSLRRMAFAAMPDWFSDEQLLEAVRDRDGAIVVMAMREMHRRDHEATLETAERLYTSLDRGARNPRKSADRLEAARILSERLDPKEVGLRFTKHATQKAAREDMVLGLADIVAGLTNKDLEKALSKKLGKGSGLERLYYVLACRKLPDARVRKAYLKLLKDKDERVACAAFDVLAERNDQEAAPEMRKQLEKRKSVDVVAHAMAALCKIGRDDAEWGQRLREY